MNLSITKLKLDWSTTFPLEIWAEIYSHLLDFKSKFALSESCALLHELLNSELERVWFHKKPESPEEEARAAFIMDNTHRYKGVTRDLFPFKSVAICTGVWDNSIPTVYSNTLMPNNISLKDISNELYVRYPGLKEFNLGVPGLIVAGGAVQRLLTKNKECADRCNCYCNDCYRDRSWSSPSDIDLFLVGLSEQEAVDKVTQFRNHILNTPRFKELKQYRTKNCVTFVVVTLEKHKKRDNTTIQKQRTRIYQIILRLYSTLSEILHGFDFGSCSVAFDEKEVYFTSLSKFAFEFGLNILNLKKRRPSYEYRICKYFNRGFGLILPNFNINQIYKCSARNHECSAFELPHLNIYNYTLKQVNPALLCIDRACLTAYPKGKPFDKEEDHVEESGYSAAWDYGLPYAIATKNFRQAVRGCKDPYYAVLTEIRKGEDIETTWYCNDKPYFPKHNLRRYEHNNKTFHFIDHDYKTAHTRFINGTLAPKRLNYLFPSEIASKALISLALGENTKTIWDTILDPTIEEGKMLIRRTKLPLTWESVVDSTNLIAPFGTASMTKKEWYGEFYNNRESRETVSDKC